MDTCANCKYIRYNKYYDEYYCDKLNEFITLDDYCGYWRKLNESEEFSQSY